MKRNKIKYLILTSYFLLFSFIISCSPPVSKSIGKPNIYHLRDNYLAHFYVYDNFQDNESCIKYLFDFAEKHEGYLIIMTNKDTYEFDDNIAFVVDTISQQFPFVREREG